MAKGQRGHRRGHPNTPSDLRKGQRGQRGHSPTSPGVPFLEALLRCPDCNAELVVTTSPLGILRAEVRHDDTCPTYRQMRSHR